MEGNEKLANAFVDMAREFKTDRYRKRAYENAAKSIRSHDKIITSGKQAEKEIKGIGKSIAAKIDEIIATGTLKFLEEIPQEKKDREKIIKQFEAIHGVGPVTAEKWYNMGYHTFESLAGLYDQMTDAQKLGYYYYNQLNLRIPREEMDIIGKRIAELWEGIDIIPERDYEIAGSYRRGEESSGDIDIVVKETPGVSIDTLIYPLIQSGLIIGTLAKGTTKYMGILRLGDPDENARRIDIRLVSEEAWPYALLYFTGSKELNVHMRTIAQSMGLSMNEYGMVGQETGPKGVQAKTEKDIFDYLGMEYLEPTERSVIPKQQKSVKTMIKSIKSPVEPPIKSPLESLEKPSLVKNKKINGQWHRPTTSLLLYISDGMQSTGNIAAFDMDWTLVRTVHGIWPKDSADIALLPNRCDTLKQLRANEHTIVIFTNQKSTTDTKLDFNFQRVVKFINLIGDIPIILMMSISDDNYRKPNTGMYDTLKKIVPPISSAFYVGDAAGRPQDFSNSDMLFAQNVGIPFYTPEQIFPSIERIKPLPRISVNNIDIPNDRTMVLFVGMPGSGKSTYYQTKLAPLGFVHANQDILGTKAKVLSLAKNSMEKGLNVCIDATNPGQDRRQEFYNLAIRYNYNIIVIYFVRNGIGFNKLREKPVPTIAYNTYYKYLIEPTYENTQGSLYQVF